MGRLLDLVRDAAAENPNVRARDISDRTDQANSPRTLSSLLSRPDPQTKHEVEAEASAPFASDRAPPSPCDNDASPSLTPTCGLTSTAATKATKATKPPLRSLSSLLSQPDGDHSDPGFWRDLYEERAAVRQYDGGYSRDEAERLAWGELQNRWHMEHGEPVPRDICAGCRRLIGWAEALDLIDGSRVHRSAGYQCLTRHGDRWRRSATEALSALGLKPPASEWAS